MLRGDDIVHVQVFERDNWICHLCCQPIDRRLRGDAWMRATIDHIIPIALGGDHTYENTKAAHWICNMKKGCSMPKDIDHTFE
jgi:5-methylcytosine-specific restriction endonuclease McrA